MEKAVSFIYEEERYVYLNLDIIVPNRYTISTFGNIFDIYTNRIITKSYDETTENKYVHIWLMTIYGEYKSYLLHRLMAMMFRPLRRIDQTQVNHIDSTKYHNYIENLEWNSPLENTHHAIRNGNFAMGEEVYNSKLTDEQVRTICDMISKNIDYNDILKSIGLDVDDNNKDMIGRIKRGITYKSISKDYNFSNYEYNFSNFSNKEIREICEYISKGKNYREIASVYNIDLSTRQKQKNFNTFYNSIKHRKTFKEISKDYIW